VKRPRSSGIGWAWVTASRRLCTRECELIYAVQFNDVANVATFADIYDGADVNGDLVAHFPGNQLRTPFSPREPVYCRRGLFVNVTGAITGLFVQYRELAQETGP
jgi:hypothetical protein